MSIRHLNSLQALDLAVRHGSLKGAAEALSITPAAVGQRIKTLEDYLGVELLVRARTGLRPSLELAGAVEHLNLAFDELAKASNALEMQRGNEIHIAADSDWINLWLLPRLHNFQAQFPNAKFCLNGEGDIPNRIGPADCEVRFCAPAETANQDVLFHDYLVVMTSPENVRRIMALPADSRLEGFPLLHLDFYRNDPNAVTWPTWVKRHGFRSEAPDRGIRFQRIEPAIEAVISNAGCVIAGIAMLKDNIESGKLALPLSVTGGNWTKHAFCANFKQSVVSKPAIKQFRKWLLEQAEESRVWTRHMSISRPV